MQCQQCDLHYQQLNLIAWLIDNVTTWVKLNGEPKVELLRNCTKVLPFDIISFSIDNMTKFSQSSCDLK